MDTFQQHRRQTVVTVLDGSRGRHLDGIKRMIRLLPKWLAVSHTAPESSMIWALTRFCVG